MTNAICRTRLEPQGLRARTSAVLARESERYEVAVETLQGADPNLHIDPFDMPSEPPPLTADVVLGALGGPLADNVTSSAAFVAGRFSTDDPSIDAKILDALQAIVSGIDHSERLGPLAHTFVEAVMSLALLGQVDLATELFTAQLSDPDKRSVGDSRAAGYLAQLGSPAGYPVLLEDLHQTDSGMVRMQSLEDLMAFVPYGGESVDGVVIDVPDELRLAAGDDSSVADQARRIAAMLELDLDGISED